MLNLEETLHVTYPASSPPPSHPKLIKNKCGTLSEHAVHATIKTENATVHVSILVFLFFIFKLAEYLKSLF
jgi:hypothetical protein